MRNPKFAVVAPSFQNKEGSAFLNAVAALTGGRNLIERIRAVDASTSAPLTRMLAARLKRGVTRNPMSDQVIVYTWSTGKSTRFYLLTGSDDKVAIKEMIDALTLRFHTPRAAAVPAEESAGQPSTTEPTPSVSAALFSIEVVESYDYGYLFANTASRENTVVKRVELRIHPTDEARFRAVTKKYGLELDRQPSLDALTTRSYLDYDMCAELGWDAAVAAAKPDLDRALAGLEPTEVWHDTSHSDLYGELLESYGFKDFGDAEGYYLIPEGWPADNSHLFEFEVGTVRGDDGQLILDLKYTTRLEHMVNTLREFGVGPATAGEWADVDRLRIDGEADERERAFRFYEAIKWQEAGDALSDAISDAIRGTTEALHVYFDAYPSEGLVELLTDFGFEYIPGKDGMFHRASQAAA